MILRTLRQRLSTATTCIRAACGRDRPAPISADALKAALDTLLEPSLTVYLLHARDQLSLSEIGRRLDLTPAETESHLASALVHLDRQIGTISPEGEVASGRADR